MTAKKTVLIVDDHPFIREGLKAIISRILGADNVYEVIGEAENGREALELAQSLRPDICLMDISLPDQSGIELTHQLKRLFPGIQVLILSMHSKIGYIADAIQAGAAGYIVKDSATEKLMDALDLISRGEYYLDNAIQTQVVKHIRDFPRKEKKIADADFRALSEREQEVMKLLAEGFSIDDISERLFISPKTVKNHRTNIMSKLDLHNSHELVRYAVKVGLLDVDLWKG